jgi:hypothetical protein
MGRKTLVGVLVLALAAVAWWLNRDETPVAINPPQALAPPVDDLVSVRSNHDPLKPVHSVSASSTMPSVAATPPQRPLPDLSEIAARQAYYDDLLQRDALELWQEWRQLLDNNTPEALLAWILLGDALPYRLRGADNQAVYAQMQALLREPGNAKAWDYTAEILGRTATPAALQILLEPVYTETDQERRLALLRAIQLSADTRWDSQFHPELSPLLENAWPVALERSDKPLLGTLAAALAKTGAPSGVELLLNTVHSGGQNEAEFQQNIADEQMPHVVAAWVATQEIHNPAAIPVLQHALQTYALETPVYQASGAALAGIGGVQAAQALLDWARTAPAEAAGLAQQWFARIPDRPAHEWLQNQLMQQPSGMSEEIYRAIKAQNSLIQG